MLVISDEDQISVPSGNGTMVFRSSSPESNLESVDGLPPACESISPPMVATYTDVNIVPEQDLHQLEQEIGNLEGEILQLRLKQRSFDEKRRQLLNKILDAKGSIRVMCRVRPFLTSNRKRVQESVVLRLEKVLVKSAGCTKEYGLDKVFPPEATQDDVFAEVAPIIKSALDGHNVCVFSYGQTGTGKTFTMDGTDDNPGIVSRALKELFHEVSLDCSGKVKFSMSMLEVYMGHLRDLLAPKPSTRANGAVSRCNLNIQTDSKGFVEIEGLTNIPVSDFNKASWWYMKGRRVRSTSWTNVNDQSSRSHCLMRITISHIGDGLKDKSEVSKLWMVDLGGSERLLKTGATGQTLDEGRAINLSLSALGDVVAALRRKRGHVPYRNSKLTQILKDSLGTVSKVMMIVHISPHEEDVAETICSLTFAKRARAVESIKELDQDLKWQREKRISELEEEMRIAEVECQRVQNKAEQAEFILSEKKKLFYLTNQFIEDERKTPMNPIENIMEVVATPEAPKQTPKRIISSSLPRFMTSTAASRQRQSESEREIMGKAKTVTSGSKNSFQLASSQSLCHSEPHFRAMARNANKKNQFAKAGNPLDDNHRRSGLEQKLMSTPGSRVVTLSNPNFRGTASHHRRRMSNLV